MTTAETSTDLRFDPPGPGSWSQDPVHFPRPATRYWQEIHPAAFKRGTNDFARFYGMLINGVPERELWQFSEWKRLKAAREAVHFSDSYRR